MTNGNDLSKTQVSALVAALISFVIAVLAVFGYNVVVVQPELASIEQAQQQILGVVMAGQGEQAITGQTVTGFTSVNVTDDLAVGDDLTALDAVIGDLTADDWLILTPSTVISVTSGGIITPTGTLQGLTSGGAVTTSTSTAIANGATSGQLLILFNKNASDAITIDGAGANVECGGNQALGATDALVLQWQTDDWECVAKFGF
jgi:hypothetical protein